MKNYEVLFHIENVENVMIQVEAQHELLAVAKAISQGILSGQLAGLKIVDVTVNEVAS